VPKSESDRSLLRRLAEGMLNKSILQVDPRDPLVQQLEAEWNGELIRYIESQRIGDMETLIARLERFQGPATERLLSSRRAALEARSTSGIGDPDNSSDPYWLAFDDYVDALEKWLAISIRRRYATRIVDHYTAFGVLPDAPTILKGLKGELQEERRQHRLTREEGERQIEILNNDLEARTRALVKELKKSQTLQTMATRPPRAVLMGIIDDSRFSHGKVNFAKVSRALGRSPKTAKAWIIAEGLSGYASIRP
jgi:hypothetical protein